MLRRQVSFVVGDQHHQSSAVKHHPTLPSLTARLLLRSGNDVEAEAWELGDALSKLCWLSIAAYLGSLRNLGTESWSLCQPRD